MTACVVKLISGRSVFLFCDVQSTFVCTLPCSESLTNDDDPLLAGTVIHGFASVVSTGNKLLRAAKVRPTVPVSHQPISMRAISRPRRSP